MTRTLTATCPRCGRDTTATLRRMEYDSPEGGRRGCWRVEVVEVQCGHFTGSCHPWTGMQLGFAPPGVEWVNRFVTLEEK